ncbi:MAG TPA: class I SAM-dependent methyltransferase [Solirubrobacterales bacterium]|jgi:ubiquinone/menaquinone biosynthesis C-methylase UbiE
MPAPANASADHIRDVNERYHDVAARDYDAKWGIDFGQIGRDQTRQKLRKALGGAEPPRFERALEIGAGTGYFSLNLMQEGVVGELVATDISTGMLETLTGNAERLGLSDRVRTEHTDAERLPFEDGSFDLVFGHAVLHHIPNLDVAFGEFRRVLRPGGTIAFCGEPSRHGDRLAAIPKRLGAAMAPLWRRVVGASARNGAGAHAGHEHEHEAEGHALEAVVDVHAFEPDDLRRLIADAGFERIHLGGEELLANVWGWWLRTLEATAEPEEVPLRWRQFAFHSYIALQRVDVALLEPRLPAGLFYNLVLSARKPA